MPPPDLASQAPAFQKALIAWYDQAARDLPWRARPSTYGTVVSEFMLQQTQVKTVLPYFEKWLRDYPSFQQLAAATEEQVLKSWEGLGYYTRARNLHKLAKQLAAIPERDLPTDAQSWLAFPGVGPYAAAAICSISFSDPSAVVDGNVVRILARLTADDTPFKNASEAAKAYRPLVDSLLNHERPGDHNQAMMELGATVCLKQSPNCLLCPVRKFCQGQQQGTAESLPRFAKTKYEERTAERAWVQSDQGVLLHKIPATAKRMKGLHEIPELAPLGLAIPTAKPCLIRKRGITRYRITERIHAIPADSLPGPLPADHAWHPIATLDALPFSGPHRRWLSELLGN